MDTIQIVRNRLDHIWQPPDFATFFATYATHPPHRFKEGALLFSAYNPLERLIFLQEGYVKLYRLSEEGRETIIYLYGPGAVLGFRSITSQDKYTQHTAEAMSDITTITMSHQEYFTIVEQHPEYLIDLMHVAQERLTYTEKKLEMFITKDATTRIAHFFYDCITRFCTNQKPPITIPFSLTHQRIAEFVGCFRETVSLSLKKLEQDGILAVHRGEVTIKNIAKLQEAALITD